MLQLVMDSQPRRERSRNAPPLNIHSKVLAFCLTVYLVAVLVTLFLVFLGPPRLFTCLNKTYCDINHSGYIYSPQQNTTEKTDDDPSWLHDQLKNYSIGGYHSCQSVILKAYCIFLYGEEVCNQTLVENIVSDPCFSESCNVSEPTTGKSSERCMVITDAKCLDSVYRFNPANACFAGNTTCWVVRPEGSTPPLAPSPQPHTLNVSCFDGGFDPECWLNKPPKEKNVGA